MKREDDTARVAIDALSQAPETRGPKSEGVLLVLRGPSPGFLYTLDAPESLIGRAPDSHVAIPDPALSRHHARISRSARGFLLEDLGSTNGTYVDGRRVTEVCELPDGARITLGARTVLRFALHDKLEQEAARSTHELTVRDPLTHAYNRRHLEERLSSEVAFTSRHGTPLALLLLDIDGFKQINDTHGHAVGDTALCAITEALDAMVRKEDLVGRYGGEEFAIIARGIDRRGAIAFAERVRTHVQDMRIPTPHGAMSMTISIGVAHVEHQGVTTDYVLQAADSALYVAKRSGRNRVEAASAVTLGGRRSILPTRGAN